MQEATDIAKILISKPSVTPEDGGCQLWIADYLKNLGFAIQHLPDHEVQNLWAIRGTGSPLFVFLGHTDVVPPGPLAHWKYPPFQATVDDNVLYGRGAADMKGGIAAMLAAVKNFIKENPQHRGSIGFIITSDEEGKAQYGTQSVVNYLQKNKIKIDFCVVGEASSEKIVGDTIKIGRRGSLNGKLTIIGKQGHIAYPQLAKNPIHQAVSALQHLCATQWDQGNEYFPPTSFQISNIHAGTGADNVIPADLVLDFNFRFSSAITAEELKQRVIEILEQEKLNYQLDWRLSGNCFYTDAHHPLVKSVRQAIKETQNIDPELSCSGGTSDGRFIAPTGAAVVEVGVCNTTVHQVNERIAVNELVELAAIYQNILKKCL